MENFKLRRHLLEGQVIPALPLALDKNRQWSPRHQRGLVRYYFESGAGGLAVAVHSTQFEIREPQHGLFEPVLKLAAEEAAVMSARDKRPFPLIAGLCGRTPQAVAEAETARGLGYAAGLLSLGAWKDDAPDALMAHCQAVAETIPLVGFYLQPAVGGRILSYDFWRRFAEIPQVVAIKMAPFNRYQTLDVVRAVLESGREDIALYTGNDDNIILDLLTPWRFNGTTRFMAGGLLGQFGVWTQAAVQLLKDIQAARAWPELSIEWLAKNTALTDANAAIFDAANGFHGCLPGIHEVLRRQGLLPTTLCLNPQEQLSPGQADEITRVTSAYPMLTDNAFVAEHRDRWLS